MIVYFWWPRRSHFHPTDRSIPIIIPGVCVQSIWAGSKASQLRVAMYRDLRFISLCPRAKWLEILKQLAPDHVPPRSHPIIRTMVASSYALRLTEEFAHLAGDRAGLGSRLLVLPTLKARSICWPKKAAAGIFSVPDLTVSGNCVSR